MSEQPHPTSASLSNSAAQRGYQACDSFEEHWKAGQRPRIEDYLGGAPGQPDPSGLLRDLLTIELAYRQAAGERPTQQEYQVRFPQHLEWITAAFCEAALSASQDDEHTQVMPKASEGDSPGEEVPALRLTLTVTEGPHTGRVFIFTGHDTFLVGRSGRAHFQLPSKDKYFSRIHFMVEVNPPHCRLMDMGSRNGTYVNGKPVTTADLRHDDEIKAGKTVMRLSAEQSLVPNSEQASTGPSEVPPEYGVSSSKVAVVGAGSSPSQQRVDEFVPTISPKASLTFRILDPFRTGVVSASQARPALPAEVCVACAAPVLQGEPIESNRCAGLALPPLCAACQAQMRGHPQPIGSYQIIREIGRGGMGIVYQALRVTDRMLVALKTITPAVTAGSVEIQRFLREANILRALDHPHIIGFREMGESNGQLFFAMEYVRGTDGERLLESHGPLLIRRAVILTCQLLEALDYAHARQFVHRDIKPANLMITEAGGREVLKLADFGLARIYQTSKLSGLTLMGDGGGTLAFMPPEHITGFRDVKPAADQYSVGATLYNLLTNAVLFNVCKAQDWIGKILQEEPVPIQTRRAEIPNALAAIINRALAKEPANRFPDIKALREALLKFCS